MGYDDDECLFCYVVHDSNNGGQDRRGVCFGCLDRMTSDGRFTERCSVAFRESLICIDFHCPLCGEEKNGGIEVPLCDHQHDGVYE
jgi:hypothetical protein